MALSVSQLASITHRLILPRAVDQFFNSNPLLMRSLEKGRKYDSGREIVQPLVYDDVNSVQAYEGAEVLSTELNDNVTAAVFQWREYSGLVGVTGREEMINEGKAGLLKLLNIKKKVQELSLFNKLGTDLQGSNSTGKELDGLGSLLSTSSSYGGIAVADMATWAAKQQTIAGGVLSLFDMQKAMGQATIGADMPTVIVTRQSVYDKVWSLIQPDQRFTDSKMADAGFGGLKFNGTPIVVDSHVTGSDGGTSDNRMQFLNEGYFDLVTNSHFDFKVVPIPHLKDQNVKLVRTYWAGNLTASGRRNHAFISTIDPNN